MAPPSNSLNRIWIGCVKDSSTARSLAVTAFSRSRINWSLSRPARQVSVGRKRTNTSACSIPMMSVATAGLPIRETTCETSGACLQHRAFQRSPPPWTAESRSMSGGRVVCTTRSPSSSWGMNSLPTRMNSTTPIARSRPAPPTTSQGWAIAWAKIGRYNLSICRTSQGSRFGMSRGTEDDRRRRGDERRAIREARSRARTPPSAPSAGTSSRRRRSAPGSGRRRAGSPARRRTSAAPRTRRSTRCASGR